MYLSNDLQQAREPFKKNKATYVVCWLDLLTPVSDFSTQRKLDSVASALPLWAWLPGLLLPATVACAAHWCQIFCEITFIVLIAFERKRPSNWKSCCYCWKCVYFCIWWIWKYVIKVHSFLKQCSLNLQLTKLGGAYFHQTFQLMSAEVSLKSLAKLSPNWVN